MSEVAPNFRLVDVSFELGERALQVKDIAPEFERAIQKTGIPVVYSTHRSAYELSLAALQKLVDRNPHLRSSPSVLIHVGQSNSDWLPATACRLQGDVGLDEDMLAFDVGQGCSGFVQALYLASKLISDYENVVIVCCDTYRQKLELHDRATSTVFSDAASATLVQRGGQLRVLGFSHLTDGTGARLLYHSHDASLNNGKLFMAGGDVLVFTKRVVFRQAESTLKRAKVAMDELDGVYVHQASKLVLDELERRFGSDVNFPRNVQEFGNTVSSSIPILIRDALDEINVQTSALCGFGVGLSSSCLIIGAR